jgi:hypothetical protein
MRGRLAIFVAVFLVLLATATPLVAKKKPLNEEGTWNVKITPDASAVSAGEKAITDVLVLQQGFFHQKGGDEHGYGSTPYTVKGSEITAQAKSSFEGKTDWTATWTQDTIAGRMVITRKDGSVLSYTFSGTRAAVEKAKKHK